MLVTLAVLLLMMTVIVKIFQAATGALNAAQVYQELDNQLRLLDSTIRSDLNGVTAKLTPPERPQEQPGLLEYGENEFADIQGEDSDDYIRFTAKAPAGRPFTGRMWSAADRRPDDGASSHDQLHPADHDHQRVRRDHLLPPQRQPLPPRAPGRTRAAVDDRAGASTTGTSAPSASSPVALGGQPDFDLGRSPVSWQGVNDLSAHPRRSGRPRTTQLGHPQHPGRPDQPREPVRLPAVRRRLPDLARTPGRQDGLTDDLNGDNVPDYYPTLYPGMLPAPTPAPPASSSSSQLSTSRRACAAAHGADGLPLRLPGGLLPAPGPEQRRRRLDSLARARVVDAQRQPRPVRRPQRPALYLQNLNHNPLDLGDNLPTPSSGLGGHPDLVGLPDLARDALAHLDRSHLAGQLRNQQPAVRPGLPAGRHVPAGGTRCSSCPP